MQAPTSSQSSLISFFLLPNRSQHRSAFRQRRHLRKNGAVFAFLLGDFNARFYPDYDGTLIAGCSVLQLGSSLVVVHATTNLSGDFDGNPSRV